MTDTTTTTLSSFVGDWTPQPVVQHDELDPAQATRLAATLDLTETYSAGSQLPMTWQWVYFSEWPRSSELGADGHPSDGHFLPPIPDRRRMFAGSSMRMTRPLRLGEPAQKRSSLESVTEKHGRTGDMLFVTVRNEYSQDGEVVLIEDQDLVYRSDSGASRPFTREVEQLGPTDAPWTAEPTPTTPLLFRYSALTSNAHRIHYDQPYVTEVEGYPDLVVHGPLLATYLAELVRSRSGGRSLRAFDFRLRKPLFLGDAFRAEGRPDGDTVDLRIVSGVDTVHVSGRGELA
ncbi:FAS1-like dehydratase domain-containing protein [Gordonia otitidis]|uniref:FAS1-like dehydratase domain-containing protein n=1 Tax=Gordonia otitidis (strain DSM 44809 / CCUG 52243 / JCM 12355 / NBRC 100426 / IFM 10032) TaxID=1108044 RepID=H5TNQ7_GORO1|nr:MaoC family dehydratase N-terminal domain-containing protein [Gordonia otitidis]GAB35115.1 hypothetical protein GOOTI_141_00040 [Gordonia otitidis NBRC 100426]